MEENIAVKKSIKEKVFDLAKKRKWFLIIGGVLILIVLGLIFWQGNGAQVTYTTSPVVRADLAQTVSATGTVKSASEVNLSFKTTGYVSEVLVNVGDVVAKDAELMQLDSKDAEIALHQAQANLASAQAVLQKMLAGSSSQDLDVSSEQVKQAETAYNSAVTGYNTLNKKLQQDIVVATQSVKNAEDALATAKNDQTNVSSTYDNSMENLAASALVSSEAEIYTAKGSLNVIYSIFADSDALPNLGRISYSTYYDADTSYKQANNKVAGAESALATAKKTHNEEDILASLDETLNLLLATSQALDDTFDMLANSTTSTSFTQTELDAYKTSVRAEQTKVSTGINTAQTAKNNLLAGEETYQTKVDSAASAVTTAENNLAVAKSQLNQAQASEANQLATAQAQVDSSLASWKLAQAQYNKVSAPTRSEDIAAQKASVSQLASAVELAQKNLDDRTIRAVFVGTVTKVNYEIGEQVSMGQTAVAVIGDSDFEMDVDIPESDIAKIKINDVADITLDAYGEDTVFPGHVGTIEPAETVISDVVYYKVKVVFDCIEESKIPTKPEVININSTSVNSNVSTTKNTNASTSAVNDNVNASSAGEQMVVFKNLIVCPAAIKDGMSADVLLKTAKKDKVLQVPQRGILSRADGTKYVRILNTGSTDFTEVDVTIGLRGDGGMVEILSGVNEGENVVTYVKEAGAK